MSLKKIMFLLIYFPLFPLSPFHKLRWLSLTPTESYTSPWGLVTRPYSYPIPLSVAETLQNLRGSLPLGYLGNPFWRPRRPTNVIVAQAP